MKIAARAATAVVTLLAMLVAHPRPAGASAPATANAPATSNPSAAESTPAPATTSAPRTTLTPGAPAPGLSEHTVPMGDWDRRYLLHIPPERAAPDGSARGPAPLIVALHGGLNDPEYVRRQSGLDAVAGEAGYVVAYPEGLLGTWNAGACCWFARWAGVDDVAFLDTLIDTLVARGIADPRRVFVTGFSNGGGMAYRYACERSARVAGIAVVSGALATGCTPAHPTSVLAFHGTWDPSVPYHGGGNMDAGVDFPFFSVQITMEYWRWLNGLPALSWPVPGGPDGCVGTGPGPLLVALCTEQRGGHEWPGYASGLMTEFFTARPSLPAGARTVR